MKNCDGCVACCNGTLNIDVYGEQVNRTHSCSKICYTNNNCSEYTNRPPVCSNFKCLWLTQDDIPEWLKPSKSGMLMIYRKSYLEIHSVKGMDLGADVFLVGIHFAYMNNWPVRFYVNNVNTPYNDMLGGMFTLKNSNLKMGTRTYE
jgi:hypothetical protein